MRVFITPWIPPATIVGLIILSFIVSLALEPKYFGFVLDFLKTIPFHLLAFAAYGLTLFFIVLSPSIRVVVWGTFNFLASFQFFYALVHFLGSNLNI